MKLVIHNGGRVWGGNEKWLTNLAIGLRERGHEVVVSCRRAGPVRERLEAHGVPTTPVRPGGDADVFRAYRFARWLRAQRADALLATSWNRIPWLVWAARRARVPRVVVRLGIVRALSPGRFERAFRGGVDAMIVNSPEVRDEWLRSAPWFPAEAVRLVYNGIRPAAPPPPEFRSRFRQELGVPAGRALVAGVGHVHHRKGFDVLIDAVARLRPDGVHAVVVGDGPERPALERRAAELGVADRVHWAGFRADVPHLLSACDAFVLSSRNEGMANVMLEAMAAGAPVVATEVSGVRAALGAGAEGRPAGWIVPVDDAAAVAGAIREAVGADGSPTLEAERRVREARARIERDYSMERMVAEAERVLFPALG